MEKESKKFWVVIDGENIYRFETKYEVLECIKDNIDEDDVESLTVFEATNELEVKMVKPELVKMDRDDIDFD